MISALFNIAGNLILVAQGKNPCLDIGESSDPNRKMCFEKGEHRVGKLGCQKSDPGQAKPVFLEREGM